MAPTTFSQNDPTLYEDEGTFLLLENGDFLTDEVGSPFQLDGLSRGTVYSSGIMEIPTPGNPATNYNAQVNYDANISYDGFKAK